MSGRNGSKKTNTSETIVSSPQKAEHHTSNINQLDDVISFFKTYVTSVDRVDQIGGRLDHNVARFDHELLRVNERLDSLMEELAQTKTRATAAEKRADNLEVEKNKLASELAATRDIIDEFEMSQRRPCLVVSNIPEHSSKSDEDVFVDLCHSELSLPQITKQDIANVSRMKDNGRSEVRSGRTKAMVIRFQNEKARNQVFMHKKKLKGSGKVITEFLTPKKSALLKECYDRIPGNFTERSIWTHFGKILVRKNGNSTKTYEIKSSEDIQCFLTEHNINAQDTPASNTTTN